MSKDKVFVALDNMDREEIFAFLSREDNSLPNIKLGLEMFNRYGPDFIGEIHEKFGRKIFLDLKLHDIPNTVGKAIASLKGLPIEFLTIHLSGGREMILQAMEQAKTSLPNTRILGVSYLTSLDTSDFKEIWDIPEDAIAEAFIRLFKLALSTKIHGVVCSAHELPLISALERESNHVLTKVTPGIRFSDEIASGKIQDQKRVMCPQDAFKAGANYLVMGRSLTRSSDLLSRINQLG